MRDQSTVAQTMLPADHRFLDEAGDTTFYGKGKIPLVGERGVSRVFIIGMVKFKQPLNDLRDHVRALQRDIEVDPYFKEVPSIQKKAGEGGFYFHATDDPPKVRKVFTILSKLLIAASKRLQAKKFLIFMRKNITAKKWNFMLISYPIS